MNNDITRIYGLLGMDYLSIPEDMRDIVLQSYERNVDRKRLLAQLEDCIKKVYGSYKKDDNYAADQKMFLDGMRDREGYVGLPIFFLREKPLCSMLEPHSYIKEWTYVGSRLIDESLVRNYGLWNYPFMGRPKEMILHKVGDIVMAVEGGCSFWGCCGKRALHIRWQAAWSVLEAFVPECVEELLRAELSEFFV